MAGVTSADNEPSSKAILFVVSSLAPGGSEKKTIMIVNRLAAKGYDVSLAYLNKPEYFLDKISKKVRLFKVNRKGVFDPRALRRLKSFIADNCITHIVAMNMYPMLYSFLAAKSLHRDIKVMASINTTRFGNVKNALQMVIYVPILFMLDNVIFGCHDQMELWVRKYFIPRKKSTVIYNGVDTSFYSLASAQAEVEKVRVNIDVDDELVIGTVARLMDEKGHRYSFECMKKLRDEGIKLKFILVGDGPLRSDYERLVTDLGLMHSVVFAGNQADVRGYLGIMDIFILSSVAVETFSNALLEAMSMSRPVIATDISGASEMIKHGKNGLLVTPGDVDGLASSIKSLLDKDARFALSASARNRVVNEFSVERMIKDYELLLI